MVIIELSGTWQAFSHEMFLSFTIILMEMLVASFVGERKQN